MFNSNIMFNHGELNGMLIGMELLVTLNGLQSASEMVYFRIVFPPPFI
jgi:predicted aspartyl protease